MNEYLHIQSTHEHTKLTHIYIFTTVSTTCNHNLGFLTHNGLQLANFIEPP